MGRERSRSRSRSPRRKERRRSRSRDRESEKKLDKFGRDVTRNERHGRSTKDDSSSSRKRDGKDRGRDDDRRERIPSSYYDERENDPARDERRQKMKEMFEAQEEELDEDTKRMSQIMGISGFDSTKGKKVNDQVKGYAKINKTQRYRQYMNRRGGFNRPLDWVQ